MAFLSRFPVQLALLLLAIWHSLRWYLERTKDGSDETWGALALVTLFVLFLNARRQEARNEGEYASPGARVSNTLAGGSPTGDSTSKLTTLGIIVLLIAYVASVVIAPNLVQFFVAAGAVGLLLWRGSSPHKRNLIGFVGLAILSSPLFATMEFFIGYPLRHLAAYLSSMLVSLTGMHVTVYGTMFSVQNQMFAVDSPCSGIKMFWVAFYLCFVLCCVKRLTLLGSLGLVCTSLGCVIAGNVLRISALLPLELSRSNGMTIPEFAHEGIGLTTFLLLAGTIMFIANRLPARSVSMREVSVLPLKPSDRKLNLAFAGTCMVTALASLLIVSCRVTSKNSVANQSDETKIVWPTKFEGRALVSQAISKEQQRFKAFAGSMAKFNDGESEILFRSVRSATRQLHSSSDCFKGGGFAIKPLPLLRDSKHRIWTRFQATRGSQILVVREMIEDQNGRSWSDVSAWYWAAVTGKSNGPWLATTVATEKVSPLDERVSYRTP